MFGWSCCFFKLSLHMSDGKKLRSLAPVWCVCEHKRTNINWKQGSDLHLKKHFHYFHIWRQKMQKPPTLKSVLKIKIFVFKNKCKFKKSLYIEIWPFLELSLYDDLLQKKKNKIINHREVWRTPLSIRIHKVITVDIKAATGGQ